MQTPQPSDTELREAYSAGYAPYRLTWKEPGWPLWKILRNITTWRRVRRLKRYGRGRRLLEVGAGAGDFLHAAHRAGWEVEAIEYNEDLVSAIRSELGFEVHVGELRRGLWEENSFDAIVLWSVIEHVPDPLETLHLVHSYLKPGGQLFLQLPTRSGIERGKWFGEHSNLLDLPRHLNFFSKDSLSKLCNLAGMDLAIFTTPTLDALWSYYASSSSYVAHAETSVHKAFRLASVGLRAIVVLPYMIFDAWRASGTEAFALALKKDA